MLVALNVYLFTSFGLLVMAGIAPLLASRVFIDGLSTILYSASLPLMYTSSYWHILYLFIRVAAAVAVAKLSKIMYPDTVVSLSKQSWALSIPVLLLIAIVLHGIQRIYIPLIQVKNPLRTSVSKPSKYGFSLTIRLFNLVHHLLPYVLSLAIISAIANDKTYFAVKYGQMYTVPILLAFRVLVSTWRNPIGTAIDYSIAQLLILIIHADGFSNTSLGTALNTSWASLELTLQMVLIGYFRAVVIDMVQKLWFWVLMMAYLLTDRKERKRIPEPYLFAATCTLISPVSIIVSSILHCPVQTVSGTPLLLVSFPRPERFFAASASEQNAGYDAGLYAVMAPSLVHSLARSIEGGTLTCSIGDVFLCRMDSRIVLARIVERWFEGFSACISGSELEPTSCHSLEGTQVDAVLDDGLINNSSNSVGEPAWYNKHILNSLVPVDRIYATAYLESKLVTTGILDQPQLLRSFPSMFMKVLIFACVKVIGIQELMKWASIPFNRQLTESLHSYFDLKWFYLLNSTIVGSSLNPDILVQTRHLVLSLYCITLGIGNENQVQTQLSTSAIFDIYKGVISYAVHPDVKAWYKHEKQAFLRNTVVQAFRQTVYYVYNAAVLGPDTSDSAIAATLTANFNTCLATMDPSQCYPEDTALTKHEIANAAANSMPTIFILSKPTATSQHLAIRLLNLREECLVRIGKLNSQCVKATWANLVTEMLYLTNDDDERHAIQAHLVSQLIQAVYRNLCIQHASAPFGYPVWSTFARMDMFRFTQPLSRARVHAVSV